MQPTGLRVFIPSKDYAESKAFYQAFGFNMEQVSEDLTFFKCGPCEFFLQKYYNEEFAKNLMLQLIVPDIEATYKKLEAIEGQSYNYRPIKQEPWGKVIYLWGPAGELWHITQLNP